MENILVFENPAMLEPKCPKCKNKINYDITTWYDPKLKEHVCLKCGEVLK